MLHKADSEGSKNKPRGRPFQKGNKRGKNTNDILVVKGSSISNEEGVLKPNSEKLKEETVSEESGLSHFPEMLMNLMDGIQKENLSSGEKENKNELELIESIDFKNGENNLTIRFSKRHNRMFRIQVFLNNEVEIRPVTYTGSSTGWSFWNLLKGAMKK